MRNKTFQPGFLFNFPHAMRFKGAGAPAVQPPAMTPPPSGMDPSADLQGYLATSNPGYYDEYTRGGGTRTFNQWLSDHLNATPGDDLWKDEAVSTWAKTGKFTPPQAPGDTTQDTPPVAPPAPVVPPPIDTGVGMNLGTPVVPAGPQTAAPPASDKSSEVRDAQREARRKAGRRKGYLSTLLARETGGYQGGEQKTLLGQ